MRSLTSFIKRLFKSRGLEIVRTSQRNFEAARFGELCELTLHLLREKGSPIPAVRTRTQLLASLIGTSASQGLLIIDALHRGLRGVGHVCEFGVAQGATSALLASEIMGDAQRDLHLFDSFEGLPRPTAKDELKNDISYARLAATMGFRGNH